MAGINPGGTPSEWLEAERWAAKERAISACQALADAIGTTAYREWWETIPDIAKFDAIREMAEQMIPDCTCRPNDDQGETACDACIAQAKRRYQEIPY